jgi:hypothetical protein
MRQAINISKLPHCPAPRLTWFDRLRALFGPSSRPGTIPLEARSAHLLRDIGLAEDVRSNPLLREGNFFRSW